jgi:nitrate reductase gamma subunit
VIGFIRRLQAGPTPDWTVHIFGYLASIGLMIGTIYFVRSRIKKTEVQFKKSHGSDWIFIILLFLVASTGILQHILHRTGLIAAANITYVIHMMFVMPWLLTMPFSKIMHMFYRPLAMYFADIRKAALKNQKTFVNTYSLSVN